MLSNHVRLLGRITHDPQSYADGKVVSISVAHNENYKKKNGEEAGITTYVRVKCFGKTAERVMANANKGALIEVDGKLRLNSYTKDGVEHKDLEVHAERVIIIPTQTAAESTTATPEPEDPKGELPF